MQNGEVSNLKIAINISHKILPRFMFVYANVSKQHYYQLLLPHRPPAKMIGRTRKTKPQQERMEEVEKSDPEVAEMAPDELRQPELRYRHQTTLE